jgi:hypothetical protein
VRCSTGTVPYMSLWPARVATSVCNATVLAPAYVGLVEAGCSSPRLCVAVCLGWPLTGVLHLLGSTDTVHLLLEMITQILMAADGGCPGLPILIWAAWNTSVQLVQSWWRLAAGGQDWPDQPHGSQVGHL